MSLRIKKDDTVVVIAGKDKGSSGRVLAVFPKRDRVLVEGVNIIKKHQKARSQEDPGGIIEKEAPLHVSNVMLADPASGAPARFSTVVEEKDGEGGKKVSIKSRALKSDGNPVV